MPIPANQGTTCWHPDPVGIIRGVLRRELSGHEHALLTELAVAHIACAGRPNASSQAVVNSAAAHGNYAAAMIAGLASFGGRHGPLEETFDLLILDTPDAVEVVEGKLEARRRIPGWGTSFGEGDPVWDIVESMVREQYKGTAETIDAVTAVLHRAGIERLPNPSCWTAAVAVGLGLPRHLTPMLFVLSRIGAWSMLFAKHRRGL